MATFERILFFQDIENETLTISQITERYKVSANTARNWVKAETVKMVAGSYPYQYTHRDNKSGPRVEPKIDPARYIPLHNVSDEVLDSAVETLHTAKPADVNALILSISSKEGLDKVESRLISLIQVARHYYETEVKD